MEAAKHDLPTLHRPVTKEEDGYLYNTENLKSELRPLPTPPHKNVRPHTSFATGAGSSTLPSILNDTKWRIRRAKQEERNLPEEDDFEQTYIDLVSKRAYRHPHPGAPKGREGCMGGTWRHMKEAIGYGPGRLMWIDGVVTLYDTESLNNERPWRGSTAVERIGLPAGSHQNQAENMRRQYIPGVRNRYTPAVNNSGGRSSQWYSSNLPKPLPFADKPPMMTSPEGKFKGFYTMSQTYS